MRLNSSALNARSLNGGSRRPVYAAGEAVSGFAAELDGVRIALGSGSAVHRLSGSFRATAQRFSGGAWLASLSADLAQTVARNAQGAAVVVVDAGLFYSKTSLGFGSAEFGLHLQGHVGVVFGEGMAVVRPLNVALDGAKLVRGAGVGSVELVGELAPSAVRRFAGITLPLSLEGEGEGSHVDSDGVRHIGLAGGAPISFSAEDGGMLRQSFIGSLDFDLQGSGSGQLAKPTLAGSAVTSLGISGDFRVLRRGQGAAVAELASALKGEVLVLGSGSAVVRLGAACTGYKTTFPALDSVVTGIDIELHGSRAAAIDGAAVIGLGVSLNGSRVRRGSSTALMLLLAESDAYLNPYAEDQNEQVFARPAPLRTFSRPASVREWRR